MQKKFKDWKTDYAKKLASEERKITPKIRKFYKDEYYKSVNYYLETNNINYESFFPYNFFENVYQELFKDIGLGVALWYAKNFAKYEKKLDIEKYKSIWIAAFLAYGQRVAAANVVGVSATAKKTIIRVLRNLLKDPDFASLGANEKARAFRKQFDKYSRFQALRLVRTESTRAANYALEVSAFQIYQGRNLKKQWMTSMDGRERSWHGAANGQVVNAKDNFIVGGEYMPRPGEGSARNVVNCRCSIFYFPEDTDTSLFG